MHKPESIDGNGREINVGIKKPQETGGLMDALSRFESVIESIAEDSLLNYLRTRGHPVEIAKRLARTMENEACVWSNGRLFAPDNYVVQLRPASYNVYHNILKIMEQDLAEYLQNTAGENKPTIYFLKPPVVRLETSRYIGRHRVLVKAYWGEDDQERNERPQIKQETPATIIDRIVTNTERPNPNVDLFLKDTRTLHQQGATENPGAIFGRIRQNIEGGATNMPSLLKDIYSFGQAVKRSGGIEKMPKTADIFRTIGRDQKIWSATLNQLRADYEAGKSQAVTEGLDAARLLGMDNLPKVAGIMSQLEAEEETRRVSILSQWEIDFLLDSFKPETPAVISEPADQQKGPEELSSEEKARQEILETYRVRAEELRIKMPEGNFMPADGARYTTFANPEEGYIVPSYTDAEEIEKRLDQMGLWGGNDGAITFVGPDGRYWVGPGSDKNYQALEKAGYKFAAGRKYGRVGNIMNADCKFIDPKLQEKWDSFRAIADAEEAAAKTTEPVIPAEAQPILEKLRSLSYQPIPETLEEEHRIAEQVTALENQLGEILKLGEGTPFSEEVLKQEKNKDVIDLLKEAYTEFSASGQTTAARLAIQKAARGISQYLRLDPSDSRYALSRMLGLEGVAGLNFITLAMAGFAKAFPTQYQQYQTALETAHEGYRQQQQESIREEEAQIGQTYQIQGKEYVTNKWLGGGKFGDVFLASDKDGGKIVIKVAHKNLDPEEMRKFTEETYTLLTLESYQKKHGLTVNGQLLTPEFLGRGETPNQRQFFAMTTAEGIRMDELMSDTKTEGAAKIISQACAVLEALHEGVDKCYLDFQPRNIFWDEHNQKILFIDWNLLDSNTPEHRARDIESLSWLLFRLSAGKGYAEKEGLEPQLDSIENAALRDILRKALNKDLTQRFQSARDFRLALEKFIATPTDQPKQETSTAAQTEKAVLTPEQRQQSEGLAAARLIEAAQSEGITPEAILQHADGSLNDSQEDLY